ncbi:MAG: xanthine dehydrogenase family protein molybdopterin-binding subunit [Acidimicrobiales bacterium]
MKPGLESESAMSEARRTFVGQRVPRVNDHAPLHGEAEFVDDMSPPGLLHAAIVRSPVAHGILRGFDASALPFGVTVLGPRDLAALVSAELPVIWKLGDQTQVSTPLVDDHLRYVGQPIGIVIAESRAAAEDGVDLVELDIEDFPSLATMADALAPDAQLLYPESKSNVLCSFPAGDDPVHTQNVFDDSDRVLSTRITIGRVHGLSIEPRGVVAVPGQRGSLTIYTSTQTAHSVRDVVCQVMSRRSSAVRVVAPDVGGGFGLKDHVYEDELMAIIAADHLGLPVKWVEDRLEAFLTTTHARDEVHDVEIAFDADGTLRGLRLESKRNAGGRFAIFGGGPLFTAFGVLPGPYKWEAVSAHGRLVATNTMSTGAYRGFGQTQAALIRERAVDLVAAELGRDRVDLRAQNMIGSTELPYQIRTFLQYDSGDYERALRRAAELVEPDGEPSADEGDGRLRGTGYCSYVQMSGIGPSDANEMIGLEIGGFESANVRLEPDGTVRIATGVSPHGQGLETTIPQLVADELGVDIGDVELIWGDTDATPYSAYGTAASRSIALGGGSAVVASREIAEKIRNIAAEMLEAAPADIELRDGQAIVAGTNVSVAIREVARRAWQGFGMPEDTQPGLAAMHSYDPPTATFSYATHACRVAVDPDTGQVEVEKYVVVNDCGTMVNPTIVEGQIHGGVAQGLGAALVEEMAYDETGQPLSSTMLDYHVPVSAMMPDIEIEHIETPSPHTPGGMKGMGEGGTNGAFTALVNAVVAALPHADWTEIRTPLTPARVWEAARPTVA